MKSFSEYIFEGTSLGSSELKKLNSKTGEKRTDILIRLIKNKTPLELVKGGKVIIDDIPKAVQSILNFENNPSNLIFKTNDGNTIKLSQLKKAEVFGGGGRGSGGGSAQTALAESAQCLWLAAMLQSGSTSNSLDYFTENVLRAGWRDIDVGSTKLDDIIEISFDSVWRISSYLSAIEIINNGFAHKGMKFHRDSAIMKSIYAAKNEACKNSGFSIISNDKWNPGDIWAVSPHFNIKMLDTSSTRALQKSILELYRNRDVVGISLKQVRKNAKHTEYNTKLPPQTNDYKIIDFGAKSVKSGRGSFWSSKSGTILYDGGEMQITTISAFSSFKVEIQGKTARGGNTGWGYISDAAQQVYRKKLPNTKTIESIARSIHAEDKRTILQVYNMVKDFEKMSLEEFSNEIQLKPPEWIHTKVGVIFLIHLLATHTPTQNNRFITKLVNYAGSQSEDSSAYVKIYE